MFESGSLGLSHFYNLAVAVSLLGQLPNILTEGVFLLCQLPDALSEILFLLANLFNSLSEGVSLLSELADVLIQVIFLCCELSDDLVLFVFLLKGIFKFFISNFHKFISFVDILSHLIDDFLFSNQIRVQVLVITLQPSNKTS